MWLDGECQQEDIPGLGQYDDFHTIDWQRDIARDRMRHRYIVKKKQESLMDLIKGAHDAWSGWVCVLLVGLTSGVMAGVIDIFWGSKHFFLVRRHYHVQSKNNVSLL